MTNANDEAPAWPWGMFAADAPSLAEFGRSALTGERGPAFLATVRKGSLPRVHPVTPLLTTKHLFVYMYPTSPKGHDLQVDGRFALHGAVDDHEGSGGEFSIRGIGRLVEESGVGRELAEEGFPNRKGYVRYELRIGLITAVTYAEGGTVIQHWKPPRTDTNVSTEPGGEGEPR